MSVTAIESPPVNRGDRNGNPPGVGLLALIREDLQTHGSVVEQGFWAIAVHRLGNWRMGLPRLLRAPMTLLYRLLYRVVEWTCGISLPYTVRVGRRVHLWHHSGMILNARSIGDEVDIRQNTTFGLTGRDGSADRVPTIEARADIGCNVCIAGEVRVGHDSRVGANSLVVADVPPFAIVAGVPARVIGWVDPELRVMSRVGVVAIGRNEGERLVRCLRSLSDCGLPVVYVDSGSTDGSVDRARSFGAAVVSLDLTIPFSAARARNAGFDHLMDCHPAIDAVFFVDGDCEVVRGFIDRALAELDTRPDVAVVCGRRREQFPQHSIYNRLADLEWDTPVGDAIACGGDALMRASAFDGVGGFDPSVPAGEEPELCQRLRRSGWKISRIDAEMTRHDLAMTRFSAWWRRQFRGGYNGRDIACRFPGPDRLFVGMLKNARNWSLGWPSAVLLAGLVVGRVVGVIAGLIAALAVAGLVILQIVRLARKVRGRVGDRRTALAYGLLTMLSKPAIFAGQLAYDRDRLRGRHARLIEYKRAGLEPAANPSP